MIGEIVALDEDGRPSFNLLQNYGSAGAPLVFYVFDLFAIDGESLMNEPLVERRNALQEKVLPKLSNPVVSSPDFDAPLADLIESVKEQGLEGLVAKRRDSSYEPGQRSGKWQKMRVNQGQELVIGGYTSSPKNFNALVLGYFENEKLLSQTVIDDLNKNRNTAMSRRTTSLLFTQAGEKRIRPSHASIVRSMSARTCSAHLVVMFYVLPSLYVPVAVI